MKSLVFLTLAFVAGEHGFAILAPFMVLILAATLLLRRSRSA